MSAPTATTKKPHTPADLVHQMEANEWGQVTGLEPHAQYFVIRRPTAQVTREMSNQMLEDLRAFVAHRREFAEKQVAEINEKVLPRALGAVQQAREEFEKRVDALTKEFETRVEKLEAEFGDRAPAFLRRQKAENGAAPAPATRPEPPAGSAPGELPMGDNGASAPSAAAPAPSEPASSKPAKKGGAKKSE